jgi:7-carboxy-7-deazaguanine synthase
MKTYAVKNIFGPTLQGEGPHAGRVVKFLRFAGCNKWTGLEKDRDNAICRFCDTDFRGGDRLTAVEILTRLNFLGSARVVVISGGEPTLQLTHEILALLKGDGYEIHLETNGSKALGELRALIDHVTVSPKQGFSETQLEGADALKVLYPPIRPDITLEQFAEFKAAARYLQPVWDENYSSNLRAAICRLYGNPEWRLSLQTHKMIEVE